MKEQSMNYCCDCGWAIRKGFIFKKWYCTCPEIMEKLKKVEISPVNGIKTIVKEKKIECTNLRGTFAYSHLERMPDGRKFCKNYKGQLRGHPAIPPKTTPYHEAPPMPERVEKAMEEHDAAYLMNNPSYIIRLHQKAKEFQAENRKLRGLITEISEFLIGGAIPGKVHLKQEYIREIYTIAREEDKKRRGGE